MKRAPRIAAVGLISLDTVVLARHYPAEGDYSLVDRIVQMPGGTTANSAVAAARLGASVAISGRIGADAAGQALCESMSREGIDLSGLHTDASIPTDETIVIVSAETGERTILWKQGARIARGARLDIDAIFASDIVFIDVDDPALYRFLADLPVHTNPNARLLGSLTYLADSPEMALQEIVPRLDATVGSARDAMSVTNTTSLELALQCLRELIARSNLSLAVITDGVRGAFMMTAENVLHVEPAEVNAIDSTGAGDAFAGALAFAIASGWSPIETLQLCSVTAGLSTTQVGAQTGLPTMEAVQVVLEQSPPRVAEFG